MMKVICEKYNSCYKDCKLKIPQEWDGISFLSKNYCHRIGDNVDFLTIKDIRKKKLEELNKK